MSPRIWVAGLALGLALVGCDKQEAKDAAGKAADAANKAADVAKDAASSAKDAAGSAAASAKDTAASAADAAKDATAKLVEGADTKITEITNYIKENKFDLAEKALTELEKIKDKLPEAVQTKLTSARTMLDNAKKAAGK